MMVIEITKALLVHLLRHSVLFWTFKYRVRQSIWVETLLKQMKQRAVFRRDKPVRKQNTFLLEKTAYGFGRFQSLVNPADRCRLRWHKKDKKRCSLQSSR